MTIPNTPPADEYAVLCEQIEALETRQKELRKVLLRDPSARTGKDWAVKVVEITTNRPDMKALREMYPKEVEEHTYPSTYSRLDRLRIDPETGELISARKIKEQAA